jgi:replicative DNA helicase
MEMVGLLTPEDFYRTSHQIIFSAINELFQKAEPVDLVTLTNFLRTKNKLDEIGGAAYLSRLVDTIPSAINVEHHARIVRDKSSLRKLIARANDITQRCYDDVSDLDQVLDFAESAVFEISNNKHQTSFYPLNKIIETNITALEDRLGNQALVTGVPTGFIRLDHYTAGLQNSDLIILAARPSMGKTALALNIARNAAVEGNIPVAIFSLEMSKEQLSMRILCSEARVNSSRIRGGFLNGEDWSKITEAATVLSEAPIFIDDSPDISATSIRTKSRKLKMDRGLGLVIIDYIQLMKGRLTAERRDLEISEISRSLKLLAKELNLPVLALSQLNRKLEERSDKHPQLSDLRESGALEQDADVVAFIYRDEVYNKDETNPNKGTAEVIIAKQRNGPTGTIPLTFLNAYTRFENPA